MVYVGMFDGKDVDIHAAAVEYNTWQKNQNKTS
jgi:hypothetical protein